MYFILSVSYDKYILCNTTIYIPLAIFHNFEENSN